MRGGFASSLLTPLSSQDYYSWHVETGWRGARGEVKYVKFKQNHKANLNIRSNNFIIGSSKE